MKIVLAGGTGLIGTALTKLLANGGHTVIILSRRNVLPQTLRYPSVRLVQWDGITTGSWAQHLGAADAVINLSGKSIGDGRWTSRQKQEILESRVAPTQVLVEAMRTVARRPKVLINQSASGYYGNVKDEILDESAPAGSDFLAGVCRAWERAAEGAEKLGVRVVRTRTAFVIDRQAPAFQRMLLPFHLWAGCWFGSGKQWFPWIHLDDVLQTYLHVLQHPSLHGPVNVAAPESLRMKEFTKVIGRVMNRPAWLPVPAPALRIVLGEMADLLVFGQRVVPKKLLEEGMEFRYPAARTALSNALLGAPRDITSG